MRAGLSGWVGADVFSVANEMAQDPKLNQPDYWVVVEGGLGLTRLQLELRDFYRDLLGAMLNNKREALFPLQIQYLLGTGSFCDAPLQLLYDILSACSTRRIIKWVFQTCVGLTFRRLAPFHPSCVYAFWKASKYLVLDCVSM